MQRVNYIGIHNILCPLYKCLNLSTIFCKEIMTLISWDQFPLDMREGNGRREGHPRYLIESVLFSLKSKDEKQTLPDI